MEYAGFVGADFGGCYMTKFVPHKDLVLIAWGKLTLDERVVLHRVVIGLLNGRGGGAFLIVSRASG